MNQIEGITQLEYNEVLDIFQSKPKGTYLIDVREQEDYEAAHIPGIRLVPMSEIVDRMEEFQLDEEYIFVCRSGRRSHEVAKYFVAKGFRKVKNYYGGMVEWEGPVETGR